MKQRYTQKELDEMRQLKMQGASYYEIATIFNRTVRGLQQKFSELGWTKEDKTDVNTQDSQPVVKVKQKTLDDFLPRDMIKHLYYLGYRIKNNKLVCVYEQVIDIKKILED